VFIASLSFATDVPRKRAACKSAEFPGKWGFCGVAGGVGEAVATPWLRQFAGTRGISHPAEWTRTLGLNVHSVQLDGMATNVSRLQGGGETTDEMVRKQRRVHQPAR